VNVKEVLGLDLAGAASLIRRRELSPVEIVNATLERIATVDPALRSFITVTDEAARQAARVAEAEIGHGRYRGPLHGVPVGLKDLFATQGIRTTNGSRIFENTTPGDDSTVAARLATAGAILVGKNNLHEFAMGSTSNNRHFGTCRNPWNLAHIPGGSSGGSAAAVAAGLCFGSVGSDTGGSVRSPACQCGIVGLKPTYGLVSRFGVFPPSWSLDHVGPIARTVRDTALLLGALAGHDARDPSSASVEIPDYQARLDGGVRGVRVGIPREYFFERSSEEVEKSIRRAIGILADVGAAIIDVSLPHAKYALPVGMTIISVEAAEVHRALLLTRSADYGADVRPRLQMGGLFRGVDYLRAQRIRSVIAQEFRNALAATDVLVTPTNAIPAPRIGETMISVRGTQVWVMALMPSLTIAHNLTGFPALTVPCGAGESGLPLGLQIIGRPFDETTVLRVGHAYEQATDWHRRRPSI
jgi:aspartyl-tRNA(Asn)/glutamyl-tRNA(Gln) amidotransferase subunit A